VRPAPRLDSRLIIYVVAGLAGLVLVSQAALAITRPELLLPRPGVVAGAVTFGTLFFRRLQNPGLGAHSRPALAQVPGISRRLRGQGRFDRRPTTR